LRKIPGVLSAATSSESPCCVASDEVKTASLAIAFVIAAPTSARRDRE